MILLATNNLHKKQEFHAMIAARGMDLKLLLPAEIGLEGWDHDETAETFLGNALGKAQALWRDAGGRFPVLADDSGLCVDALGGKPGIYSARWGQKEAGRKLTDHEKNLLLLGQIPSQAPRTARFVCSLALVAGEHRVFSVEESWEGEIAPAESGTAGFGYDPLFYIPSEGKTASELSPERKNALSHRGKAFQALSALMAGLALSTNTKEKS